MPLRRSTRSRPSRYRARASGEEVVMGTVAGAPSAARASAGSRSSGGSRCRARIGDLPRRVPPQRRSDAPLYVRSSRIRRNAAARASPLAGVQLRRASASCMKGAVRRGGLEVRAAAPRRRARRFTGRTSDGGDAPHIRGSRAVVLSRPCAPRRPRRTWRSLHAQPGRPRTLSGDHEVASRLAPLVLLAAARRRVAGRLLGGVGADPRAPSRVRRTSTTPCTSPPTPRAPW